MDRWATFDCYGTLIDWNGGIGRELERLFGVDRASQMLHRYHEVEPEVQREEPTRSYREVLALTLARLGDVPVDEQDALGRSLPSWQPFPEVRDSLEEARSRGWKLAILSNTDREFIDASMERIGVPFELAIVASEIGSYKPAHRHWEEFAAQ
ncbi:MAG: HAD family hydrolase, partial [Gaiellaceae bacterium]